MLTRVSECPRNALRTAPTVVLVGRPNVGKSTLFNRITGSPGAPSCRRWRGRPATRTPMPTEWQGTPFTLVDTGGMFGASDGSAARARGAARAGRRSQRPMSLSSSWMAGTGFVPADEEIAGSAQGGERSRSRSRSTRPTTGGRRTGPSSSIGWVSNRSSRSPPSTARGRETCSTRSSNACRRDRNRRAKPSLKKSRSQSSGGPTSASRRCSIGCCKEERSIVSDMPGTTRDSVDAVLRWQRRMFRIVDTAGIRRSGQVARSGQLEGVSVILARRAIEKADVAVLVIDCIRGRRRPGCHDRRRSREGGQRHHHRRQQVGPDEGAGAGSSTRSSTTSCGVRLKFLDYAPVLHISAATGERTTKLLETIDKVADARMRRVPTGELNRFLKDVTAAHPARQPRRRNTYGFSTPPRRASRRRRSSSSRTSRPSSTFPTSGSWRTSCASRSD